MLAIRRTLFLKESPAGHELQELFTPNFFGLGFAGQNTRQPIPCSDCYHHRDVRREYLFLTRSPRGRPRRHPGDFILSPGAAGLIYEVVLGRASWFSVFGNTTQAVSAILTGYFGGMAIGSALGGRLSRLDSSAALASWPPRGRAPVVVVLVTPVDLPAPARGLSGRIHLARGKPRCAGAGPLRNLRWRRSVQPRS